MLIGNTTTDVTLYSWYADPTNVINRQTVVRIPLTGVFWEEMTGTLLRDTGMQAQRTVNILIPRKCETILTDEEFEQAKIDGRVESGNKVYRQYIPNEEWLQLPFEELHLYWTVNRLNPALNRIAKGVINVAFDWHTAQTLSLAMSQQLINATPRIDTLPTPIVDDKDFGTSHLQLVDITAR